MLNKDQESLLAAVVRRPWGWYLTTLQMPGYKTKVLSILPGARLSLQTHKHRSEMWSIIKGEGLCTVGDEALKVEATDFVFIPLGAKHRIENLSRTGDLIVAEVQIGDYLEEDDIVRYEDDFGRVSSFLQEAGK